VSFKFPLWEKSVPHPNDLEDEITFIVNTLKAKHSIMSSYKRP